VGEAHLEPRMVAQRLEERRPAEPPERPSMKMPL
jgi:hypothetical protein